MKRLLLIILLLPYLQISAQSHPVPYYEVLTRFFSSYHHEPEEPVDGISFAKKKEGWFVHVVDQLTEELKEEYLFWSPVSGWQALKNFAAPLSDEEQAKNIAYYLSGRTSYTFNGYERCLYYGYNGWDFDVIQELGSRKLASVPDTLLEGLGRAYSSYSSRFSWYQYGGVSTETDSLKKKLAPLEMPSKQRVDSVAYYIRKATACFAVLKDRNPSYQTLVGNSGMKHFNEQMFGYDQMSMAGYDNRAREFINDIQPNATIIKIAKNYLDNCPPNAILFTYGDVDTYPLWYIQEAMNYRKDVSVLNVSLLGLSYYVEKLHRNKTVRFNTPREVYGEKRYQYGIYQPGKDSSLQQMPVRQFLAHLFNKENWVSNAPAPETPSYPVEQISLSINPIKFKRLSALQQTGNSVLFTAGKYMTLDQMLMLDIIATNIYQRPICFTSLESTCSSYLFQTGLVYQLHPLDSEKEELNKTASMQKIASYLKNKFQPLTSYDLSTGISPHNGFDLMAASLYGQLIEYYWNKNEKTKATDLLQQLKSVYKNKYPRSTDTYLGHLFALTGDKKTALQIFEANASLVDELYRKPSAIYAYMSKENAIASLEAMLLQIMGMEEESEIVSKIYAAIAD